MSLIANLSSLFAKFVQPAKPAYTTIIYPTRGKAFVLHDGLGIRHEPRWQQSLEPLLQDVADATSPLDSLIADNLVWSNSAIHSEVGDSLSNLSAADIYMTDSTKWVNPANGLPSLDGCIDVMGNLMGMDSTFSDSWSDFSTGFSDICSGFDFD